MPRMLKIFTLTLLPVITLALGWQLGGRYEQKRLHDMTEQLEFLYEGKVGSGSIQNPATDVDFALIHGVWRLLLKNYIAPEKLQVQPMLYGAAMGLVKAVGDPYTTFMTPKENDDFQQSLDGKLEGIGAELTMREEHIVVVAPLKGSPAAVAGLLPEDIIIAVDETDIAGETLSQVVQRIRGPKGTQVTLTVIREKEPEELKFTITRDEIKVPSTEAEVKKTSSGSIGYIAINQFGESTAREVEEAVQTVLKDDIEGIILDVRYNGGGYLERAVEITSLFLQQGKVVTVSHRQGDPDHHYVNGRPLDTEIPLVVLMNEGSASASEILAGALKDHKRATIIGKKSFGKGTVQEIFDLPGGSSVRITTARWLTPSGHDLGEHGVDPDIEVDRTIEQARNEIDPQLDAALEWLLDGENLGITSAPTPTSSASSEENE